MDAQSIAKTDRAKLEKQLAGYFLAVTGATIAFMAFNAVAMVYDGAASSVPFPERAGQLAVLVAILGLSCWFFAVFWAAIPFVVTYRIARHFAVSHALYFVFCGALTGLFLVLVFAWLFSDWAVGSDQWSLSAIPIRTFWMGILPGAAGAFLYWWQIVRR